MVFINTRYLVRARMSGKQKHFSHYIIKTSIEVFFQEKLSFKIRFCDKQSNYIFRLVKFKLIDISY